MLEHSLGFPSVVERANFFYKKYRVYRSAIDTIYYLSLKVDDMIKNMHPKFFKFDYLYMNKILRLAG